VAPAYNINDILNPYASGTQTQTQTPAAQDGLYAKYSGTKIHTLIYERINNALTYPGHLIEKEIDGTVTARLVFNEKTRRYGIAKQSLQSAHRALETFVARVLKRALQFTVPQAFSISSATAVISCFFEFQLKPSLGTGRLFMTERIIDGKLYFYRGFKQNPLSWKVGPISGFGVVPAVSIDPLWIFRKIGELF
jgi:hypothetical protein